VAKFPLPSAAPGFPPPAARARGGNKKLLLLGGMAVGVLAIGAGVFFYLTKPEPPPPQPAAKKPAAIPPAPAVAPAQSAVEKAQQEQLAPLHEVVNADQAAQLPAAPAAAEVKPVATPLAQATPPPKPKPAGPPPASIQFKAWVENLRISGVRSGASPRIFIERTAYAPGDIVNPQLGISFKGYDPATRLLSFTDQTGAIVERRN
jgi:hypothetical protein